MTHDALIAKLTTKYCCTTEDCNCDEAAAALTDQAARIKVLEDALKHQGGPLCMARHYPDADCTCGVSKALEQST